MPSLTAGLLARLDNLCPALPPLRRNLGAAFQGADDGDASCHLDDHLGSGVALFQISDRRRDLGERIAPVDLGAHLAGREQLFRQQLQILGADVGLHPAALPPRSETPSSLAMLVIR